MTRHAHAVFFRWFYFYRLYNEMMIDFHLVSAIYFQLPSSWHMVMAILCLLLSVNLILFHHAIIATISCSHIREEILCCAATYTSLKLRWFLSHLSSLFFLSYSTLLFFLGDEFDFNTSSQNRIVLISLSVCRHSLHRIKLWRFSLHRVSMLYFSALYATNLFIIGKYTQYQQANGFRHWLLSIRLILDIIDISHAFRLL